MAIEWVADKAEGIRVWLDKNRSEDFHNTYSQFVTPVEAESFEEHLAASRYEPENYSLRNDEKSFFCQTSCMYATIAKNCSLQIGEFSADIDKLEWKNDIEQFFTPMAEIRDRGLFLPGNWESVLIFGSTKYGGWNPSAD